MMVVAVQPSDALKRLPDLLSDKNSCSHEHASWASQQKLGLCWGVSVRVAGNVQATHRLEFLWGEIWRVSCMLRHISVTGNIVCECITVQLSPQFCCSFHVTISHGTVWSRLPARALGPGLVCAESFKASRQVTKSVLPLNVQGAVATNAFALQLFDAPCFVPCNQRSSHWCTMAKNILSCQDCR